MPGMPSSLIQKFVPVRKTRHLQWDKLYDKDIPGTIWEHADTSSWQKLLDPPTLEVIFASADSSSINKKDAEETPLFVDGKRAMNIDIVLGGCGKGVDPAVNLSSTLECGLWIDH